MPAKAKFAVLEWTKESKDVLIPATIENEVKKMGHGCVVRVPREWFGRRVRMSLLDDAAKEE